MTDMVNSPPHYKTESGLEAITVIKAFFRSNYNLGQVFKYIARCGKKNDDLEDLKKARWYLDKEIEWREETGDDSDKYEAYTPYGNRTPKAGDQVLLKADTYEREKGFIVQIRDVEEWNYPYRVEYGDRNRTWFNKDELWCRID